MPPEPTTDQPTVTASPPPVPPTSEKSHKKLLIIIAAIVIVLIAGVIVLALTKGHKSTTTNSTTSNGLSSSTNPANIKGIAVNTYPYFSACQIYKDASVPFAGLSNNATIDATYAEGGLRAKDIPKNFVTGNVYSDCSWSFGSDTSYAGITVIFRLYQYPTVDAAKKQYDANTPSQAQRDAASKAIDSNLPDLGFAPLAGATNTVYSDSETETQTLYKNIVISFDATSLTAPVNKDQFKQSVIAALPIVTKDIDLTNGRDLQSLQALPRKDLFGQKLGAATYVSPCELFTADIFNKGVGRQPNPAEVKAEYNINVDTAPTPNPLQGANVNSCVRYTYPGSSKQPISATSQVHYFTNTGDAATWLNGRVSEAGDTVNNSDVQEIKGIGDRAVYLKPRSKDTPFNTYYVLKGPYVLQLTLNITNTDSSAGVSSGSNATLPDGTPVKGQQASGGSFIVLATADQYNKLAQLLLPKLP